MPFVRIEIFEGRPPEKKKRLIEEVSRVVAEVLEVPISEVILVLTDIPRSHVGIGGKPGSG
jgi:4-oxalocrotonate tautomerase